MSVLTTAISPALTMCPLAHSKHSVNYCRMNECIEKSPLNLVTEPQDFGEAILREVVVKEARL